MTSIAQRVVNKCITSLERSKQNVFINLMSNISSVVTVIVSLLLVLTFLRTILSVMYFSNTLVDVEVRQDCAKRSRVGLKFHRESWVQLLRNVNAILWLWIAIVITKGAEKY